MKSKLDAWRRREQLRAEIDLRRWFSLQSHRAVALGEALYGFLRKTLHRAFRAFYGGRKIMARPQGRFEMSDGDARYSGGDSSQASEEAVIQVVENATYQDVLDAPEHRVAELIHGKLYLMSRPAGPHARAASRLGMLIGNPFDLGVGGPGGWLVLGEPELHLIKDIKVMVPDLAGWKLETMAQPPQDHKFTVMPDWICEVLSPSTRKKDLDLKAPEYAEAGVEHLWMVDPAAQTLQAFELQAGEWAQIAELKNNDTVCVSPFDATTFSLGNIWVR